MKVQKLLNKLVERKNLTVREAEILMEEILRGNLGNVELAAILTAFRIKGESIDEILGFIKIMRKFMKKIHTRETVIDTCGTGGDRSGTFNISTTSAFVAAGAGAKVVKHGNRSASSICGSADVLEELGMNINLISSQAKKLLCEAGFTFLFAPVYHPSMRYVACVRRKLKIRTVFNFLGPFSSPAQVKRQIIGVPSLETAKKLSQVASKLEYEHLMIVTSEDGLDEISISAPTYVFEIRKRMISRGVIKPEEFGIKRALKNKLLGNDARANAKTILDLLHGDRGPKRDIVLLNSAAALYVAGKVRSIKNGLEAAKKSIDDGSAKKVLEKVIKISNSFSI